jgi:hypothetical protein
MSRTYWFWAWLVQITVKKSHKASKIAKGEVWRNLVLVQAGDEEEAIAKALKLGRGEEGDSEGSLTLDGKPAFTKFLGIEHMGLVHDEIEDGVEILFECERMTIVKARQGLTPASKLRAQLRQETAPYRRLTSKHTRPG